MNIFVFNVKGTKAADCLGVLDTYKSFNFTKKFQGVGTWTLRGSFTQESRELLRLGNLIYVNPRVCGVIYSVNYDTDENGITTYAAYGMELKGIMNYRIVWDMYNHALPAQQWIKGLVQENTQDFRKLFDFYNDSTVTCPKIDKQVSYKKLGEVITSVCESTNTDNDLALGWDITCDIEQGFTFSLLEGENRTITSEKPFVVSRDLDNVSQFSYSESNKETVTHVLCGGAGEGSERIFVDVGLGNDYGYLRRKETFKDSKSIQQTYKDAEGTTQNIGLSDYQNILRDSASEALKPDTISVDAETVVSSSEALGLLGAKVTLIDRAFGVKTEDFVTEINYIDEADGPLTTITIGEGLQAQKIIL